ncbi:MAG TPA: hypothetical protein VEY08_11885 [Chloroflexia bacterium]|nr:hypothetical protein [Chloroflexia bacterium]
MPYNLLWGPFLGEESRHHKILYQAQPFDVEALTVETQLVTDPDGQGDLGLHVTVRFKERALAQETRWGLGIFGAAAENAVALNELANPLINSALHQAHLNVLSRLEQAEADVKALREIKQALSYVDLWYEDKRARLTLAMAHNILLIHDEKARRPTRVVKLAGDLAACINIVGKPYAYIGFNPNVPEYHRGQGRFGFFKHPGPQEGEA